MSRADDRTRHRPRLVTGGGAARTRAQAAVAASRSVASAAAGWPVAATYHYGTDNGVTSATGERLAGLVQR
ncbi:hypothetical protein AB0M37_22310, partial [Micromonospora chalcea]